MQCTSRWICKIKQINKRSERRNTSQESIVPSSVTLGVVRSFVRYSLDIEKVWRHDVPFTVCISKIHANHYLSKQVAGGNRGQISL